MNRDGGFESDLALIRNLLRKYGWSQFESMVQIAGKSRKPQCEPRFHVES